MLPRDLHLNLIRCHLPAPKCERCGAPLPDGAARDWLVEVHATEVRETYYA